MESQAPLGAELYRCCNCRYSWTMPLTIMTDRGIRNPAHQHACAECGSVYFEWFSWAHLNSPRTQEEK